jgi:hypothetical protein
MEAKMFIHSNTSTQEFLDLLRDNAIRDHQPPQYIDAIDRLITCESLEAELESVGDELYEMEKAKKDLYGELEDLLTTLDNNLPPKAGKEIERAMKIAWAAVERHAPEK